MTFISILIKYCVNFFGVNAIWLLILRFKKFDQHNYQFTYSKDHISLITTLIKNHHLIINEYPTNDDPLDVYFEKNLLLGLY